MLRDFLVFQRSVELYKCCKILKIPNFLKEQLLRASSSVALNIAEGSGRRTPADQKRFYSIALGSLRECEAIFELENVNDSKILDLSAQIGAMLHKLSIFRQPVPSTKL
jgi:four helix bundle protein